MKKDVAEMWATALESGEYDQGRSQLAYMSEDGNISYCCLGVLCELAIDAGVDVRRRQNDDNIQFDGQTLFPPDVVVEWAGLDSHDPLLPITETEVAQRPDGEFDPSMGAPASSLNDVLRFSFPKIADRIREKFL